MPAGDSTRAGCVLGYSVFEFDSGAWSVESRIREFEWGQLSGSLEDRLFSPPVCVESGCAVCLDSREADTQQLQSRCALQEPG